MEEFRRAFSRIEKISTLANEDRVNVALIDDGVDICDLDNYNNVVQTAGFSCCPPLGRSERPWHRSGRGHGTIMANMIVRVNPWVYLYVIRIQESTSRTGNRMIYTDSAATGIKAATDLHVNIISISWTVESKVETGMNTTEIGKDKQTIASTAIANLGAAVDDVIRDGKILMFCSTSDDIMFSEMDILPYQKGQKNVFRIGAALPLGQRDHQSEEEDNIDFYMPGNRVAAALNPRSADVIKYHDGASVSTALAAGLGSLIMHCAYIAQKHLEEKIQPGNNIPLGRLREALRRRHNMHTAFTNIDAPEWKKKKYLPVWKVFGPAAEEMNRMKSDDDKMDVIVRLVQNLCYRIL
ncbi:intracellular serine protease [Fusarium longipes]|uniref:Intracellular serine protease n=1 Tax=Fusarium longipes TaxID=694270 RepID=A0A395T2G8_9HYPO|nr:intracellular serine protease [Fusarium longipes]